MTLLPAVESELLHLTKKPDTENRQT